MNKKEFEKYREEVLETLKNYRKDIEKYPDETLIKLKVFWDNFRIKYQKWIDGEDYPSLPKGAGMFFIELIKNYYVL